MDIINHAWKRRTCIPGLIFSAQPPLSLSLSLFFLEKRHALCVYKKTR